MKAKKKKPISMEKLTEGYEEFIKDKAQVTGGKEAFQEAIRKALKKKKGKPS